MKRKLNIVVLFSVLAVATVARADISNALPTAESADSVSVSFDLAPASAELPQERASLDLKAALSTDHLNQAGQEPVEQDTIGRLPNDPSSTALFLWAFGGWGATRLGRSAKKFQFANLPEWFHADAPGQIGHTVQVQLDQNALPICHSDELAGELLDIHLITRVRLPRLKAQFLLGGAVDTRGPPICR